MSHEAVAAHHGNNYLPLCEQFYKSHRPTLFSLVESVELEATSSERSVLDALEFIQAVRGAAGLRSGSRRASSSSATASRSS